MYEYKATIVRVVDGDTVDVDIDLGFDVWVRSQRIRLFGVDTPECRTRNKARKPTDYSQKPTFKRLSTWEEHMRSRTREKGKFGRYLGEIKTGNGRPLRNSSSKKSWLSRTPARIKKT